jgi:hypothetical protein
MVYPSMDKRLRKRTLFLAAFLILPIVTGFAAAWYDYNGTCGGWMDSPPAPCPFSALVVQEVFFAIMLFFLPIVITAIFWTSAVSQRLLAPKVMAEDWAAVLGGLIGLFLGWFALFTIPKLAAWLY